MSVDPIFACPRVAHFRAPQLGALMLLARAFWEGGARPLPSDDTTLMLLSGLHARQWSEQRDRVLMAWREIEPGLASVYAQEVQAAAGRRIISQIGAAASVAKRKQRAQATGQTAKLTEGDAHAKLVPQAKKLPSISHNLDGERIPARVKRGAVAKFVDAEAA